MFKQLQFAVAVATLSMSFSVSPLAAANGDSDDKSSTFNMVVSAGAIAFLPQSGPFAWNGLLVFWSPFVLFGLWIAVTCYLLLGAIKLQRAEEVQASVPAAVVTA